MLTTSNVTANPFLEFVSKGDNPLKILISEFGNKCNLFEGKSKSLYILSFNYLACQACFDFALSCNYFSASDPIVLDGRRTYKALV
jgi:hypothetical protein